MATVDDLKASLAADGYDETGTPFSQSQNSAAATSSSQNLSPYNPARYAADIAIGLGQGGQGLHNTPYNIANYISPAAGQAVSKIAPPLDLNFGQMFGVPQPSLGDRALQGVAQFAPYAAGGAAAGIGSLSPLSQALAVPAVGGLYGATQSQNPVTGALEGAAGAAFGGALGAGVSGLAGAASGAIAKSALGQQLQSMGQNLRVPQNVEGYMDALKNYMSVAGDSGQPGLEGKLHQIKTAAAKAADDYGYQFDNSDYVGALQSKIGKLQTQSTNNPATAAGNQEAIEMLQNLANSKSDTFSDALSHVQSINQMFKQQLPTDRDLPFTMLKYAKGQMENSIDANLKQNGINPSDSPLFSGNNDLQSTLGAVRDLANQTTKDRINTFEQTLGNKGKPVPTIFSNLQANKATPDQANNWINDFLPNKNNTGTAKFDQLSQMLGGDQQQAAQLIKSNHFQDVYNGNDLDANKFMSKYNKLPIAQQQWLFTPEQNQNINLFASLKGTSSPLVDAAKKAASASIDQWPATIARGIGGAATNLLSQSPTVANWAIQKQLGQRGGNALGSALQNVTVPGALNYYRKQGAQQ